MKKAVFFSAMIFILSAFVFGQNGAQNNSSCTGETVQKISSRGIKIGAEMNDVINLFAETESEKQVIQKAVRDFGVEYKSLNFGLDGKLRQPNERFEGISDYNFNFLDNRLSGFYVSYTKPVWDNTAQFTAKMAEIFNLPDLKNWETFQENGLTLKYGNYKIITQTDGGRSSFNIDDNRIGDILRERKRKADAEQREKDLKTFKP